MPKIQNVLDTKRPVFAVLRIRIREAQKHVDPVDPDPEHCKKMDVFGPPGSGSTSQRYGSGSGSGTFYYNAKIVRKTLIPTIVRLFLNFYL
jgi:hypothetical protein